MVASRRTKRRRPDRPAIPLVLYGGPVARSSPSVVALAWGCVRAVFAFGVAVVLGGAALVGASFLEPALGPAALVVTAAVVLAAAFVLRCAEGCSAWVAAALVCAAAVPATAFWLDLDALEAIDRVAAALAGGFPRWREHLA